MARDEDLSALLPDPPPPRGGRRDAAIEAAMLRFDGGDPTVVAPVPHATRPAPRWSLLGRSQYGGLVTAVLVGVIAVPIWLSNGDSLAPTSPPARTASPEKTPSAGTPTAASPAAAQRGAEPAQVAQIATANPQPAKPAPSARAAGNPVAPGYLGESAGMVAEPLPAPAPLPPPPPPPPPAEPAPAPAPAAAAAKMARAEESATDAAESIVVTGFRASARSRPAESRRARVAEIAEGGAWDACTVRDDARDLSACRKLVNPAASGRNGRAAAQVADGLSAAWRGDNDAAIAAFDRAVAQSPGLAFAYLNRGLVRERKGDIASALADLDKAVRLAPNTARGYYQRGLFLRRHGEPRRARDDWERAVKLDPRAGAAEE